MVPPLRIVFFGTPAFAVPTLEALLASQHPVVGVVTQPDRPRGRGQKQSAGPVKALAEARGLPVLQPERLKEPSFLDAFSAWHADLGVVAAYGRIIPEIVINTPAKGLINVHGSLLPRYRGAAPVHRAVLNGDTETGVTIMRIVKELDAGAMFASIVRPIGPDATSGDVEHDLAFAGARLLVSVVDEMAAGTSHETPQDASRATYAAKITREESAIAWSRSARELHNQVRGLMPWPRASALLDGQRVIIVKTAPESGSGNAPGAIVEAESDCLRVATGDGILRILELQPEGRRALTAREFLAGHRLSPGTRFQ